LDIVVSGVAVVTRANNKCKGELESSAL